MRKIGKDCTCCLGKQENPNPDQNGSYHSVYDSGKEKRKKGKIFFFKKGYCLKEYREAGKGYQKTNQDKISAGSCVYAAGCHLQQSGNQQDQGVFSSEERKKQFNNGRK